MTTTDLPDVPLGSRLVVRHRLPVGAARPLTDVIGVLTAVDDASITMTSERSGEVRIPRDTIVVAKPLAPRPIRNSEIRALERAAVDAWPGTEQEWIGGWLARAGGGVTRRANSALPAEPALDADLPAVVAWYVARGLTPRLSLPDRVHRTPAGWVAGTDVDVLTLDLEPASGLDPGSSPAVDPDAIVRIDAEPDDAWLARHGGDARSVVTSVLNGTLGFLQSGFLQTGLSQTGLSQTGSAAAGIARAAVTTAPNGRTWVGLTAVRVEDDHRRRGLATRLCVDAVNWGAERGATGAYVQVERGNDPARRLYEQLGFVPHHAYRYAVPAPDDPVTPLH